MHRLGSATLNVCIHQCEHTHKLNGEHKHISFSDLCFLLMVLFPVARSALVEVPKNTVVWQRGSFEAIIVPCKSDSYSALKWYVQKNYDSEKEALYNGFHLRPDAKSYCTVITDQPGKNYLRLKNAAEAAQTYICLEPGTLDEASADLIWIESDPICTDSSTEDHVSLTCSIEFRGNWAPTMEWKQHSIHGERDLSVGVNASTIDNNRVTSTLVMPEQMGSRNYTCATKFHISGKPNTTTATNVPNYNRVWTSPAFPKFQGNPRSSNKLSIQQQNIEMAAEPDVQYGDSGDSNAPLSSATVQQDNEMVTEFNMQYGDTGNSINPRISEDSSTHHHYEIVVESNVQFEDSKPPPLHQSASDEQSTEDHSEENFACEGYLSLHRDSSAKVALPSVYTTLHLYANISSTET